MNKIIDDIKLEYKMGNIAHKFIYWNIAVFLLSLLFFFRNQQFLFPNWLALYSDHNIALLNIWTLITYAFLHDSFWHLFFNMMVLNLAGRLFLTFFNNRQFIGLYFLSAIFAGICFVFSFFLMQKNAPIVGASASIMAILVATSTYQPLMNIRLLIIGNIKLWHLTAVILLFDFMSVFADNSGGHIAHLAGAFFGFLYIKLLQNGTDLSKSIMPVLNLFNKKQKTPFKKVHTNYTKPAPKPVSKIVIKDKTQQQIDEILDKISKSGYDSLSENEKDFLFRAGN